ncbi:3-isopropylmalate dehydratase large subunit [Prauserella flavalba]|uniref:3-isopropylmalate dehydratase large subunit n=1 Tax=Prauserella flavalba TaxID=1477506 RepID=UPI0036EC30DE
MARTLFEKVWSRHVVRDLGDGFSLLFVDRHMVNDVVGRGLLTLNRRGLRVQHPELTFAGADHTVATLWNATEDERTTGNPFVTNLRDNARRHGFRLFDTDDSEFGIIHVVAAEQGIALPGGTVACGDSHTCTLGALGALAWGLGQSDVVHILATQTMVLRKPKTMRITVHGRLPDAVTAKDLVLFVISKLGVNGGAGFAVEFAGEAIRALPMESRFTVCNMSIEFGARFGMIAPDDVTYDYLRGREHGPRGAAWDRAVEDWRTLPTDPGAVFDRELRFDAREVGPQISWGINPAQTIGIEEVVPSVPVTDDEAVRATHDAALRYVGLDEGRPLAGLRVDMVFIGSCVNARLSDLRLAADVVRGRQVADHVTAWVSPGSERIRREAEAEGLDRVFTEAGFGWGRAGCSMCAGAGDQMRETGRPGQRIVSTTNRNFIGRQGPDVRTHLASPATAAATAIAGHIVDARTVTGSTHA